MKRIFFLIILISVIFFSCASDNADTEQPTVQQEPAPTIPVVDPEPVPVPEPEPVIAEPLPETYPEPSIEEPVIEEPVIEEQLPDEPVEEPLPVEEPPLIEEPPVEETPLIEEPVVIQEIEGIWDEPEVFSDEEQLFQEEYLRSIEKLANDGQPVIPREVFEEDKNQIFLIIDQLEKIMKTKNFQAWLGFLTPDSASFWSNKHNLQELSRNLFTQGEAQINNIREYFEYFFIPARRGRVVDEIRYVTADVVKVVQYKDHTDIIYYYFEKIDGEWKLRLDTFS